MNAAKVAGALDSEHVSKLLSDAKTTAFQLKEDAEAMESFTRVNVSWESHASAITVIKNHVNELERIVNYGKTKARFERLSDKLELPVSR